MSVPNNYNTCTNERPLERAGEIPYTLLKLDCSIVDSGPLVIIWQYTSRKQNLVNFVTKNMCLGMFRHLLEQGGLSKHSVAFPSTCMIPSFEHELYM